MDRYTFQSETTGEDGKFLVISVSGHIDASSVDDFSQSMDAAIQKYPDCSIIIPLSKLDYINSSGLGVLIQASQTLGNLALVAVPTKIQRIMQLLGLAALVTGYDTLEEAVLALSH